MFQPRPPDGQPRSYERPLPLARGSSRRRLEVFSPKLGRRASLGSYEAWKLWLALEANPLVESFCERPAYLPARRAKPVDFWVRTRTLPTGEFWLLRELQDDMAFTEEMDETPPRRLHGLPVRLIDSDALREWSIPVANWSQIMPHLAAWHRFPDELLAQSIAVFLGTWQTRQEVLERFADRDAAEVEAALYALLVKGRVTSPDLASSALGGKTRFRRA